MARLAQWLPGALLLTLATGVLMTPRGGIAADIGYIEDFALARDRATALKQLIPGTEDYYYFHALHYLNTEQFDKAQELFGPWQSMHGETIRLIEIKTRLALLSYDKDPDKSLSYVKSRLGLTFDHQRMVPGAAPDLPTALDPKRIDRDTLYQTMLRRNSQLNLFEDAALDRLAGMDLSAANRRALLQRLQRPDIPNLAQLVSDDLRSKDARPFGEYAIHRMMTIPQLEELLKLQPELLNTTAFVQAWIAKLQPSADADWQHDRTVTREYYTRLEGFVQRLKGPVHNSLKAHVLYHLLVLDRAEGKYNKERFLAYLQLPRRQHYMPRPLLESPEARNYPADLNMNFAPVTHLPPIGSDEDLVRSYLRHFLTDAATPKEFEPYIESTYLTRLFAQVKVEAGLGDLDTWAAQLPPAEFAQIKERIDIDFAYTNASTFQVDEPVRLDLYVKNVPNLIVKVFEVNTQAYYRTQMREVDTDINLDGLVPNWEQTHKYGEPPLRRVARRFEFPELNKPGVYVIDFIGSGKSSRALIRKGRLRPIVGTSTAGQTITVIDAQNKPVPGATVRIGTQEYTADAKGVATIPYSSEPGRRAIILSQGDFACLDHIDHQGESYQLRAGFYVDREALLTQREATILVRPALFLADRMVSLKLLEEVRLEITSVDASGISSSTEIRDFKVFEDREATHVFRVPPRMTSLKMTLTGKVKSLSQNTQVNVADSHQVTLNAEQATSNIVDLHFARFGNEYLLELRGRTGEIRPEQPVSLSFKHRDIREPITATLKSDAKGQIRLGALPGITTVTATGPQNVAHTWEVPQDHHTYRGVMHAQKGDVIRLPYVGSAKEPSRFEFALFEIRSQGIAADRYDAISQADGQIVIQNLTPGDYELWLKAEDRKITLRIADGPVVQHYVVGTVRHLEVPRIAPVQISSTQVDDKELVIRLKDAGPLARVHVLGTRYAPGYSAFDALAKVRPSGLQGVIPTRPFSVYLTGRNIGDEYRYVLDRQGMKHYPGNMLDRPELLLNPWMIRVTETGEQAAQAGEDFRRRGVAPPSAAMPASPEPQSARTLQKVAAPSPPGGYSSYDFLANPAAVLTNLVPDEEGVVRVPRVLLASHGLVRIVAVDPLSTTERTVSLAEPEYKGLDLRLADGLDPQKHFTQQKQISILAAGKSLVLQDAVASRFEAYDSLPSVFTLYRTMAKDERIHEFAFLMQWPSLAPEAKGKLYSQYACHELNFFLFKKDPEFFNTVVKPYLANKKDKTFLDLYLLGADLAMYLEPWRYDRLNVVERILLAQRIQGEPEKTARHLLDIGSLIPRNVEKELQEYDFALSGSLLQRGDRFGLSALQDLERETKQNKKISGAVPGIGGGGFGGGIAGGMPGRPAANAPAGPGGIGPMGGQAAVSQQEEAAKQLGRDRAQRKAAEESLRRKDADKAELFFDENRKELAEVVRQLYRRIDPTSEWAENNYYKRRIQEQIGSLITVNPFWVDYARHAGNGPFLSQHVAKPTANFAEMMFAVSVLDLPFKPAEHVVKFDAGKMTMTPAGPVIAFHEEVQPAAAPDGNVPVLIGQNYFREGERFRTVNGERVDQYVTGEFLINTVYGCQVVVTNPTSSRQRLNVLIQLPVGAMPLSGAQFTRTVPLDLQPYHTQTIDTLFYFPGAGQFAHFPAHVAKEERVVAAAKPTTLQVVPALSKPDTSSWAYVSQNGTEDEVIAFLNRENVNALDLNMIAFRLKDRAFFEKVITLLKSRHVFQPTLWSYAVQHNHAPIMREYLVHVDAFVNTVGGPIDSPLLQVDPIARHTYEHLEYKPVVNARTHALGNRRQIVNSAILQQYHSLLKQLSYTKVLDDTNQLAVVYYLLLQDRIEEAEEAFARVNPERVTTRLQYDYCSAYLAMYQADVERAKAIALRYANHPVDHWRNRFLEVSSHIEEAQGRPADAANADDVRARQDQLAATEPTFETRLEGTQLNLSWQNMKKVTVNYYLMDVELLFSRNPFTQQGSSQFAYTRPNASRVVELPADQNRMKIDLPEELRQKNVLVEVVGAGKTQSVPYYASAMDVKWTESYGQVRTAEAATGKPLPRVYVKVYAQLASGQVKFHKDGYTDLRGRFDYATVSTPESSAITRFSVLVLSGDKGTAIREVPPPQR